MSDLDLFVLAALIPVVGNLLLAMRWTYSLIGTRDKPPEWEPTGGAWPFHPKRDGYRRLLATCIVLFLLAAVVFLGIAIVRLQEPPFPDWRAYASVGTCVVLEGPGTGSTSMESTSITVAPCPEPHTHVVAAHVDTNAPCPRGTDAEWNFYQDVKICLRADN